MTNDIRRIPKIIKVPSLTTDNLEEDSKNKDLIQRIKRGRRKSSQPYPPQKPPSLVPVAKPGSNLYLFIAQEVSPNIDPDKSPILFASAQIQFEVRDEEKNLKSYIYTEKEEVEAFAKFLQLVEEFPGIQIVSYGARTFFFPRLNLIGMANELDSGNLFKAGDKYNNYMSRYSPKYHTDMMDCFTNYGSVKTPSLIDVYSTVTKKSSDNTLEMIKDLFTLWDKWKN